MVGHTNLDERVAADFDRAGGKGFLESVAVRLRKVRPSEIEVGVKKSGTRMPGTEEVSPDAPSTRRPAMRSSMDAGITGGLTLFGTRDGGK